jgi:hypothetical protein
MLDEIKTSSTDTAIKPRYVTTPHAAIHLGLSPRTLEKHRCYGTGPAYRKLGGRVVYAIDDLEAWAELETRRSTSDPGLGVVRPAKRSLPNGSVRTTRK